LRKCYSAFFVQKNDSQQELPQRKKGLNDDKIIAQLALKDAMLHLDFNDLKVMENYKSFASIFCATLKTSCFICIVLH